MDTWEPLSLARGIPCMWRRGPEKAQGHLSGASAHDESVERGDYSTKMGPGLCSWPPQRESPWSWALPSHRAAASIHCASCLDEI